MHVCVFDLANTFSYFDRDHNCSCLDEQFKMTELAYTAAIEGVKIKSERNCGLVLQTDCRHSKCFLERSREKSYCVAARYVSTEQLPLVIALVRFLRAAKGVFQIK